MVLGSRGRRGSLVLARFPYNRIKRQACCDSGVTACQVKSSSLWKNEVPETAGLYVVYQEEPLEVFYAGKARMREAPRSPGWAAVSDYGKSPGEPWRRQFREVCRAGVRPKVSPGDSHVHSEAVLGPLDGSSRFAEALLVGAPRDYGARSQVQSWIRGRRTQWGGGRRQEGLWRFKV